MRVGFALIAVALLACGVESAGPERGPMAGTAGTTDVDGAGGGFSNRSGAGGAGAGTSSAGTGAFSACQSLESRADAVPLVKSDVIWAVSNSPLVEDWLPVIRDSLNYFADRLDQEHLDPRVILLSEGQDVRRIINGTSGVCAPAPLGSGSCPDDTNPPRYTRLDTRTLDVVPPVEEPLLMWSHLDLDILIGTYHQWRGLLRPGVAKAFIVMGGTDPIISAPQFIDWVASQRELRDEAWTFSGTWCLEPSDPGCYETYVGDRYTELANATGGVAESSLASDYRAVIDSITDGVIAGAKALPCQWTIPEPPGGKTLDPEQVNMVFTSGAGKEQPIFAVDAPADCGAEWGGWYYDDPAAPTEIQVCPTTCATMRLDAKATVDLAFGCERQQVPVI